MKNQKLVLRFDEVTSADSALVGSKGMRLAEMATADLPVLPGFCVTTAAYQTFLSDEHLNALIEAASRGQGKSSAIYDYLTNTAQDGLPPGVAQAIKQAYQELGSPVVAVRSSATFEDNLDASFAGQYDTFLNVAETETVLEKVRACWAGLWSERAQAYMREQGIDPIQAKMGVVVQTQANAQAAGVLFTLNPLTGLEEQMMVEAAWGMGEAVVSGRVTPDRYVIDIKKREVLTRDISNQSVILVAGDNGALKEKPLPLDQTNRSVLSDEQLLRLIDLGSEVQSIYGYPQDIEWALVDGEFVLLQTRPLTSFSFAPDLGQWTSGNYREVLPGFASPLAMSLSLEHDYGRALSSFFRDVKLGEAPPNSIWGKPFFGRAYWNVGIAKQLARRLPGFKERVFDRTVGIEPTYEKDGVTTPWTPWTILRALPVLFALNDLYKNHWREGRAYRDRFLGEIEPGLDAVQPESLDDGELAEYCRQIAELHWQANNVAIRISLLSTQAQDDFEPMIRRLNATLPPGEFIVEGDLITGLSDVRTAQSTLELWQLARSALEDPHTASIVSQNEPGDIPDSLQATQAGQRFLEQIQAFVARYRYMAPVDEDLIFPRWDEDSSFVFSTLQAYACADESTDPARRLDAQRLVRRATERRALQILSRGWRKLWLFGRRSFINQLRLVRRYVWWREETRVIASRAFYQCRRFFKELGKRWAAQGILEAAENVFLLRWPAIEAVLNGQAPVAGLRLQVKDYQDLKTRYLNFDPPGVIGRGANTRPVPLRILVEQRVFEGIPCSSGEAIGAARVVETLEEARALQQGEILVARYTNPSWTPLFNLAGGIIIEEGGLLSHGAVVAREYGIPAVLRIERATKTFKSGQRLRVDGSTGTVEIL